MTSPLAHFRRPCLAADTIAVDPGSCGSAAIVVRRSGFELRLDVDGNVDAARDLLLQMRDPEATVWQSIGDGSAGEVAELARRLDRFGWIHECAPVCGRAGVQRSELLDRLVRDAYAWLRSALDRCDAAPLRDEMERAAGEIKRLFAEAMGARPLGLDLPPDDVNPSREALRLLVVAWQRTSPLSVQVLDAVLAELRNPESVGPVVWDVAALSSGDLQEVAKQVWTASVLIVLASGADAAAFPRYLPALPDDGIAGLNLLVLAEQQATKLMLELGDNPVLGAVREGGDGERIAALVYQHQYYLTLRYVEAVLALCRNRLDESLHAVARRYLAEELGHEVHELNTCIELGLTTADVRRFAPFPFFAAYPDILGCLAERNPVAFCLAVTVAEGMPGAGKELPRALARAAVDAPSLAAHSAIDVRLDHGMFTRRFFAEIPWVPSDLARSAIRDFLFVVELSQRGWRQLAAYASSTLPVVSLPFGMTPQEVITSWAPPSSNPLGRRA